MLGMRRLTMNDEKIEIIYSSKELELFRRDILAGNLCDIFLPVSFIQADGSIGAVYDMHGYKYYGEIKDVKASTLIGIVTSLMEKSKQADRRYFFTGEYSLDPRLVFVDTRIPDAALIYRKIYPQTRTEVLESLKRLLQPERAETKGVDYVRKALFILSDHMRSFEIIRHDLMAIGTEAFRADC